MSKYIDLELILHVSNIRKVYEYDETGEYITYLAVPLDVLENAVEHIGQWEWKDTLRCSVCNTPSCENLDADIWSAYTPPFCPNCGAKMVFGGI